MATVGYGDYYPVTIGGRLIGIFLMITGISLFGVLTATFAQMLIGNKDEKKDDQEELKKTILHLTDKISQLEEKLGENQNSRISNVRGLR